MELFPKLEIKKNTIRKVKKLDNLFIWNSRYSGNTNYNFQNGRKLQDQISVWEFIHLASSKVSEIGIGIAGFLNKRVKELHYTTHIVLQTTAISDTEKVQGIMLQEMLYIL